MIAVANNLSWLWCRKNSMWTHGLAKNATASQAGRCPTHETTQCKARFLFIRLRRFSQFGSYSSCPVKATLQKKHKGTSITCSQVVLDLSRKLMLSHNVLPLSRIVSHLCCIWYASRITETKNSDSIDFIYLRELSSSLSDGTLLFISSEATQFSAMQSIIASWPIDHATSVPHLVALL